MKFWLINDNQFSDFNITTSVSIDLKIATYMFF